MKSTGILHLMAVLLLAREKRPLDRDVIFAATADEETGGQAGVVWLLANHPRIETNVLRHSPKARVIPYLTPFGTDGNYFRRPDRHVYDFFPVVMSAEEAMSMHSDAERIPVAPFEKGLRMFYDVVAGIAGA